MKKNYKLSAKQIRCYGAYLREQERADSTVQKYLHDLAALLAYLRGRALTKAVLLEWKGDLAGRYAPASVNTMLAAVNGFLRFMGWGELTVRFLKIQKALFCDERRELTRADYDRWDLLIGMDQANLRNMRRLFPDDPEQKLHLLMDYTSRPGQVADPWYTGDFEATWRDVLEGCRGLLYKLQK